MMRFIERPNLPEGEVKAVICGELRDELKDYLATSGIETILISPNDLIDSAIKNHADMAVFHLGGDGIITDKNQKQLISRLKVLGMKVIETEREITGEYPNDISLNFTAVGDKIIGNFPYMDESLKRETSDLISLPCKQGYCKCSCLVVSENALITDDKSIYNIATVNGIDCLLIEKGDVTLPGHEYGFIGGASGKISKNEVLFFGDITQHRDYKEIAAFINKHGCKIRSLHFPLTDFGGIIPIVEEI